VHPCIQCTSSDNAQIWVICSQQRTHFLHRAGDAEPVQPV